MAKAKMMNESSFAKMVKELNALGELIRTRQEEKQAVIDEFDKERLRFRRGKISEDTMRSSSAKANKEFSRINKNIREAISKSNKLGIRIREFVGIQSPKSFVAKVSGVMLRTAKKKIPMKKKFAKSKISKKSSKKKKFRGLSKKEIAMELKQEKKLIR